MKKTGSKEKFAIVKTVTLKIWFICVLLFVITVFSGQYIIPLIHWSSLTLRYYVFEIFWDLFTVLGGVTAVFLFVYAVMKEKKSVLNTAFVLFFICGGCILNYFIWENMNKTVEKYVESILPELEKYKEKNGYYPSIRDYERLSEGFKKPKVLNRIILYYRSMKNPRDYYKFTYYLFPFSAFYGIYSKDLGKWVYDD